MTTFGLAVLSLVLWWATAFGVLLLPMLWRSGGLAGDWMVAVPVVMIFGSMYAVPMAIYLAGIDVVSRRMRFPINLAAFGTGVLIWVLGLFGLAAFTNNPAGARDTAIAVLLGSAPGAGLFLVRQLMQARHAARSP